MPSSCLPPEVTDHIIDHCHSDPDTLSACGLVCKAWYGASRYHLFAAVELSKSRAKHIHNLLRPINTNSAITIIPFIQELSLHLYPASRETWLETLISALPEYIPLRTLRIFCHGVQVSSEVRSKFTTTFRSITYLALFESTLLRRSFAEDVKFICSFPELETILFYGHHRHDLHLEPNEAILPKGVRTLKLDLPSVSTEAFAAWLLGHEHVPTPAALHIFRVTENSVPELKRYLQVCKDTLEDLMLFLYQWRTDPSDFDISEHHLMKSIYLNSNGSSTLETTYSILSSVFQSGAAMENVLLRIGSYELAQREDWAALNDLIASLGESCTTTVVMDDNGTYEEEIRERLHGCRRLDIVSATSWSLASRYVSEVYDRMKQF